jgi:hypothetical protein
MIRLERLSEDLAALKERFGVTIDLSLYTKKRRGPREDISISPADRDLLDELYREDYRILGYTP